METGHRIDKFQEVDGLLYRKVCRPEKILALLIIRRTIRAKIIVGLHNTMDTGRLGWLKT